MEEELELQTTFNDYLNGFDLNELYEDAIIENAEVSEEGSTEL